MAQNFLPCDRDQELLLPPSLREWLPEDHLAWFVLEAVDHGALDHRPQGGLVAHVAGRRVVALRQRLGALLELAADALEIAQGLPEQGFEFLGHGSLPRGRNVPRPPFV